MSRVARCMPRLKVLKLRCFEPIGAAIHVFTCFFVLVLLLVTVLEEARSMTSTSAVRLGGFEYEQDKSPENATSRFGSGLGCDLRVDGREGIGRQVVADAKRTLALRLWR